MTPDPRPQQFRQLYDRHFRVVWSVVGQLGMVGAAREDVVQEIWLTAYRRLHTLDKRASSRAWLCSISRKVVWRFRRNARRFDRRVGALAHEPQTLSSTVERQYQAATELEAALGALSPEQRGVLVLSTVHGLTAPEISESLGVSVNTVYSRLRLARDRLAVFEDQQARIQAALDRRDQPQQSMRGQVWALLLPRMGEVAGMGAPALVGSIASWPTVKAAAIGMALGVTAIVGLSVATAPPPARPSAIAASSFDALAPAVQADRGSHDDASAWIAQVTTPTHTPAAFDPVPVADAAMPRPRRPMRATKATISPTSSETETPDDPVSVAPAPELAAEAELLRRAQTALGRGRAKEGLALLRQHEQKFKTGALADVRDGAMVRALCALERADEAAAIATRLSATRPDSPVTTAVLDVCRSRD